MKVKYDKEVDILYIHLSDQKIKESDEEKPGIILDYDDSGNIIDPSHKCELLWQGLLPKRMFVGFKFQEAKSSNAARKLLESKNATHYWDMVQKSEVLHQSTTDLLDFI